MFSNFRFFEQGEGVKMVDFIEFYRLFDFSIRRRGSKWSTLLNFTTFRLFDLGEGLNGRFNLFFSTFRPGGGRGGSKSSILLK